MAASTRHHLIGGVVALTLSALVLPPAALAVPAAAGTQPGRAVQAAKTEHHKKKSSAPCNVGIPVIGGAVSKITNGVCGAAEGAAGAVGELVGEAASAVGNGVMDLVANWMIGAATSITGFVSRQMQETTTPQLESAWYEAQFAPMADLGAALGLLVTLIAFASAAIRRSPEALAATLAGIVRAGLGTGLAVALTVIGLEISDQISSAVLTSSPHTFWVTVSHAWGTSGFGGFGSSALAMLIAFVEVFAGIFVWLELIIRNAGIYVAVLFFPITLAAAIWQALNSWPGRLSRLLLLFVILKPVVLIVLSLAGNAAAAGLSFGSGVSSSVGAILAAIVIFALAAFAPWALMYLLAADAESAYMAAGMRAAAGAAVADESGPSIRSAGGLRNIGNQTGGGGGGSGGGSPGGGGGSDGGGGGGGGGSNGSGPSGGGPSTAGEDSGAAAGGGAGDDALAVGGESIGAGSVGAAAGVAAQSRPASEDETEAPATADQRQDSSGRPADGSASTGDAGATRGSSGDRPAARSVATSRGERGRSRPARGGTSAKPASPATSEDAPGDAGAGQQRPATRSPTARPLRVSGDGALPRETGASTTVTRSPRRSRSPRSLALVGTAARPRPDKDGEREE
jgi:type IV secretion system protein TrbL